MKEPVILRKLKHGAGLAETGNKAASLLFLQRHRFRIPVTYILAASCRDRYLETGPEFMALLVKELSVLPDRSYAVRSSTTLEDSSDFTFAGQFQTVTNVSGTDNLVRAILEVWQSSRTGQDSEYRRRTSTDSSRCAVIIQEMVDSKLAGVSFSKNPVTGRPETIIEAVEGQGEELVQKGAIASRWRFAGHALLDGNPSSPHYELIKRIAADTRKIKSLFRRDADIEWAFDGNDIYYLQVRPVTGAGRMNIYSNRMAKEMLPGQVKPLVWSVNIPVVNGTWISILERIVGHIDLRPGDLARQFFFRTYFNVAALSSIFREFGMSPDSLEELLFSRDNNRHSFKPGPRILKHSFRIARFALGILRFESFFREEFRRLDARYRELELRIAGGFDPEAYPGLCNELFSEGRKLTYLNIFAPMLMQFHHKKLAKRLRKLGLDYEKLDFAYDFPELDAYSPLRRMNHVRDRLNALPAELKSQFVSYRDLPASAEVEAIREEIDSLIKDFGHFSESGNDFSIVKWKDDPDILFNLIIKSGSSESQSRLVPFSELVSGLPGKNRSLRKLFMKAGRFKLYREKISSLFIFGHGLFRYLFLGAGARLASESVLARAEDVFYLYKEEVDSLLGKSHTDPASVRDLVERRKQEMELTKDYVLPTVIYGDNAPVLETGRVRNHYGTGTSAGSFTGTTRVVRGAADFDSVNRGDILLIPFSDVSWTPILTLAGAIVAETGGMLSHFSIIAREMGIPALSSIDNACALGNGLKATVDGSNGILTIHDYE